MRKILSLGLIFILTISLIGCQKKYTIEGLDLNNIGEYEQNDLNILRDVDDMYYDTVSKSMDELINTDNDTKIQLGMAAQQVYKKGTYGEVKVANNFMDQMFTDMGKRELDNYIKIISKYYDALWLYADGELQNGDELLTEDVLKEYKSFHKLIVEYTE